MLAAIDTYHSGFKPSEDLAEPYVMVFCINVVAPET